LSNPGTWELTSAAGRALDELVDADNLDRLRRWACHLVNSE
jgi:hypothetical protein